MTIVACLLSGVGADSRTKRFGNYTIGSRNQSDCIVCDGGVIAGNSKAPSNRGLTQIESESISSEAVGLALTLLWVDRCIGCSWLCPLGMGQRDSVGGNEPRLSIVPSAYCAMTRRAILS